MTEFLAVGANSCVVPSILTAFVLQTSNQSSCKTELRLECKVNRSTAGQYSGDSLLNLVFELSACRHRTLQQAKRMKKLWQKLPAWLQGLLYAALIAFAYLNLLRLTLVLDTWNYKLSDSVE